MKRGKVVFLFFFFFPLLAVSLETRGGVFGSLGSASPSSGCAEHLLAGHYWYHGRAESMLVCVCLVKLTAGLLVLGMEGCLSQCPQCPFDIQLFQSLCLGWFFLSDLLR